MNKLQIIGYVGGDAEIIKKNDSSFAKFTVAVDESYKNKEGVKVDQTTWFNCILNDTANKRIPYLKKGTLVYVEGKLRCKIYTNKKGEAAIDMALNVGYVQLLSAGEKKNDTATKPNIEDQSTANTWDPNQSDDLPF